MDTDREQSEQQTKQSRWGFRGMTVREWLPIVGALLIPVVIAAGTWGITWQQGKIENRRAKAERKLAEQRAQDEALQAYLDQMGTLLLEKNLRSSEEDSEVRTLARARTLTVLERLGSSRKTHLLRFLTEANLLGSVGKSAPIIGLSNSNLGGASVTDANLTDADLQAAELPHAYLALVDLSNANLSYADLEHATIFRADLIGTNLGDANLRYADVALADLSNANLTDAYLFESTLDEVDLHGANLRFAHLFRADLRGANLSNANLTNADLSNADLSNAKGITNEELAQQAASLEGATMPNGQKYEDWLKDKKAQGKDEKNE